MDDKDFDVHVATEHNYRQERLKETTAKKQGISPPAMQKALDIAGQAASALGTGLYDIANPVHTDEEGQIDWGKTIAHGAVEAPIVAKGLGYLAGTMKRGYNAAAGVDPTIAAQNAISEQKIKLDQQKLAESRLAREQRQAGAIASSTEMAAIEPVKPTKAAKGLDPVEQKLAALYEQQQAQKAAISQAAIPTENAPYTGNVVKQGAEANIAHNQQQILGNKASQAAGGGYSRAQGSVILVPDELTIPRPPVQTAAIPNVPPVVPSSQRGGINIPAIAEAGSKVAGAVKPVMGQAGALLGSEAKGAAAMLPFMLATDVRAQNAGYRRELENQLKAERNANRIAELQSEIKKLDEGTYINALKRRYVDKNIPVQFRPQ